MADSDGQENSIRQTLDMAIDHHTAGRLDEAGALYKQVLKTDPNNPEALHLLGIIAQQVGQSDLAIELISHALSFKPDYAEALNSLGIAYHSVGKITQSIEKFNKAIAINPDYGEALSNLGAAHQQNGELDKSVASYQKSIALNHDNPAAHYNLGNVFKEMGQLQYAEASFLKCLSINPDYAEGHNNLGTLYKDLGQPEKASKCFQKALDIDPTFSDAHSNKLLNEQYRPDQDAQTLYALHCQWGEGHGATFGEPFDHYDNKKGENGPIRIGFVSADFRRHPLGYFLIGLFENTDDKDIEIICFSDSQEDDLTQRLKKAATEWIDCKSMSNAGLAKHIHSARIDILFDLAGHTAKNRLPVFALKPAPVQVTWAGYVGTTGLKTMDYLLSDQYYTPPSESAFYREKILNMPDAYVCYEPPFYAPDVAPPPCSHNSFITFGSFNNPSKINERVLILWAQILQKLPDSKLLLKYKGMNDDANASRIRSVITDYGIDPGRVHLEGGSNHKAFLECYNRIDIALDTFPYSGGLTTCEALWMGLPVITLPGNTFASRHSFSYLKNVGIDELVAASMENYLELAVSLAGNVEKLGSMRAELRSKVSQSPICNYPKFANDFSRKMHEICTISSIL